MWKSTPGLSWAAWRLASLSNMHIMWCYLGQKRLPGRMQMANFSRNCNACPIVLFQRISVEMREKNNGDEDNQQQQKQLKEEEEEHHHTTNNSTCLAICLCKLTGTLIFFAMQYLMVLFDLSMQLVRPLSRPLIWRRVIADVLQATAVICENLRSKRYKQQAATGQHLGANREAQQCHTSCFIITNHISSQAGAQSNIKVIYSNHRSDASNICAGGALLHCFTPFISHSADMHCIIIQKTAASKQLFFWNVYISCPLHCTTWSISIYHILACRHISHENAS